MHSDPSADSFEASSVALVVLAVAAAVVVAVAAAVPSADFARGPSDSPGLRCWYLEKHSDYPSIDKISFQTGHRVQMNE